MTESGSGPEMEVNEDSAADEPLQTCYAVADDSCCESMAVLVPEGEEMTSRNHCTISLEQEVLTNHLILGHIFKHSTARDLKNYRLVSKLWDDESVATLIQRRLLKLTLSVCRIMLRKPYVFPVSELSRINAHFLETGKKLPVTSLDLDIGVWEKNFDVSAIAEFAGLFSSGISRLVVRQCRSDCNGFVPHPIQKLRDLLQYFPKVEDLVTDRLLHFETDDDDIPMLPPPEEAGAGAPFGAEADADVDADGVAAVAVELLPAGYAESELKLFYKPTSLSSLKTVEFNCTSYDSVFKDLIISAPNLQSVPNFNILLVNVITETGLIRLVKEYRYNRFANNLIHRLSKLRPELSSLIVDTPHPLIRNGFDDFRILRHILRSSKDSLKSLCCYPFRLLDTYKREEPIPSFPNLKTLHLFYPGPSPYKPKPKTPVFPKGMDFKGVFPSVETVVFGFGFKSLYEKTLQAFFPDVNFKLDLPPSSCWIWMGVTRLEIRCGTFVSEFGWMALGKLCPNVKHFKGESFFHLFGPDIRGIELCLPWTDLETIDLGGFNFSLIRGHYLDSFLLGIPSKDLSDFHIRQGIEETEVWESELRALKTWRSISDYPQLKKVKITFDNRRNAEWKPPENFEADRGISLLSWSHGFALLPTLFSFTVAYDQDTNDSKDVKALLEPVLPFINFEHAPLNTWESEEEGIRGCCLQCGRLYM